MTVCWVCGTPAPVGSDDCRYVEFTCVHCGAYAVSRTVLDLSGDDPFDTEVRTEMLARAKRDLQLGEQAGVPRIRSRDF